MGQTETPLPSKDRAVLVAADPAAKEAQHAQGAVAPKEKLLQVGELANAVGKTVRAIHHYEELGLIVPNGRSKGRFRLYDADAVTRVRWISKLHDLGLSLVQIQEVASAFERASSAGHATAIARQTYVEKLTETRAQIDHLKRLEHELQASIAYLDACGCDSSVPIHSVSASSDDSLLIRDHDLLRSRRAPTRASNESCSDHLVAPSVGSCVTCDQRERSQEPELVAGLLGHRREAQKRELQVVGQEPPTHQLRDLNEPKAAR